MARLPSPFDRYYDEFYRNTGSKTRYEISLADGVKLQGRPWASPLVALEKPTFMFDPDGGRVVSIPFAMLLGATRLGPLRPHPDALQIYGAEFVRNTGRKRHRYQISLSNGRSLEGIPWDHGPWEDDQSEAHDPRFFFSTEEGGQIERIRYAELAVATRCTPKEPPGAYVLLYDRMFRQEGAESPVSVLGVFATEEEAITAAEFDALVRDWKDFAVEQLEDPGNERPKPDAIVFEQKRSADGLLLYQPPNREWGDDVGVLSYIITRATGLSLVG